MAKHFTLAELTHSAEAAQNNIDNTPPADAVARLNTLADKLLDPVRELWGGPLTVNSGYRCTALNRIVGGAARSAHLRGEAADITTGSTEGNRLLFNMIVAATCMNNVTSAATAHGSGNGVTTTLILSSNGTDNMEDHAENGAVTARPRTLAGGSIIEDHAENMAATAAGSNPGTDRSTISGNLIIDKPTVVSSNLEFDQLIDERGYRWLHISYRAGANRRQILHL